MIDFKPLLENNDKLGIYINLDSLIDTRLSILHYHSPKLFKNIIKDLDGYQARLKDEFDYIDVELFQEMYKKRNSKMIKEPIPTFMPDLIKSYVLTCLEEKSSKIITLHLNVYPYKFSLQEKELLKKSIFKIYKGLIDVEILDKPDYDISVKFIQENIALMIMYNGIKWVEHNLANKKLRSLSLPDVLMICPRLVDKVEVRKTAINDFFSDFEKIMHPFIQLLFLTPRIFSIKINKKK